MAAPIRAAARGIGAPRGPASLGAKLVLILTGVGLMGSLAIALLLAFVITPNFNRLEGQAVDGHVDRTRAALAEYAAKVENSVRDYGDWNSSYDYMAHQTRAFEQESFSPLAMANLDVEGMAYVASDGHIVIARWLDPKGNDQPAMRQRLIAAIGGMNFTRALNGSNSGSFYTRIGPVVAAVGVAQVRRSDGSGTPRGLVLMVRRMSSAKLSELLQLKAVVDPSPPGDAPVITRGSAMMQIAVPVPGIGGRPVASATFSVPRDVSLLGRRMLLLAVAGAVVLLLIVLMVLRRVIARLVLKPLAEVEQHMQTVRDSGTMRPLAQTPRHDEIGSLGASFNAMLRQLKDLREQVEVQSFALGRSESAVAVMHNVRNALNPISTILSQGIAQAPPIDRAILDRAIQELADDALPDARRHKLVAFLATALNAEAQARDENRRQLQVGREAMSHVLEIIGQQQSAAHERPALEACDVTDLVAQNAAIARYSGGLSIAFNFPAQPHHAMATRVILSQVIGNLFANAGEAIAATGRNAGSISVTIYESKGRTEIRIRDDGEGFASENAPTFFQRGFSTRAHKSGGLGLHWCANSMTAMEGSLRLESEGKGKGAVAILSLRAAAPAEKAVAA